jgi:cytochrome c oxidase accessory protein FixG
LFDGTAGRGGVSKKKKSDLLRVLRFIVYALLSMVLAHTFLAFFVGTDKLAQWIRSTPIEHPFAFLIMFGTTVAMMFDFLYFREQTCLIACPYGRFQSVMLDRNSLIVGYDYGRGEPRGKMRKHASLPVVDADKTQGDCVDCHRCVAVCPTGIDIRNGLQMECINCTQCIDACNDVMRKIGRPEGLIRYTSQNGLERRPTAILRPRTILYPLILLGVATAFFAVLSTKFSFDARLLRTGGNPFSRGASGELRNSLRVRLVNRTHRNQTYSISAPTPTGISVTVIDPNLLTLQPGESSIVPIMVELPTRLVSQTKHSDATLEITDLEGNHKTLHYILLGLRN